MMAGTFCLCPQLLDDALAMGSQNVRASSISHTFDSRHLAVLSIDHPKKLAQCAYADLDSVGGS